MMFRIAVIGMVVALQSVPVARAAVPTLYERIKLLQEKEVLDDVEPVVARYTAKLIQDAYNVTYTAEDISAAVRTPGSFLGRCGSTQLKHLITCEQLQGEIRDVVKREQRVRHLGRDLLISAGSYELGLAEYPGAFAGFPMAFGSILHIWPSGSDRMFTTDIFVDMSAAEYPEPFSTFVTKFNELREGAEELIGGSGTTEYVEELTAVVARYRFGYKAVLEEGDCTSNAVGGGGELGLLTARWCGIETALDIVWNAATAQLATRDPPVGSDELVVFPTWAFRDLNLVVWVNNRDAGIEWEVPLEPVQPRLIDDSAYRACIASVGDEAMCGATFPSSVFLGGRYRDPPEDPEENTGLCRMPIGRLGFLCRTLEQNECSVSYTPVLDDCPFVGKPYQTDTDSDSVGDSCDNCPLIANADQADTDDDGAGNVCDSDASIPSPGASPGSIIGRIVRKIAVGGGGTGSAPLIDEERIGAGMYLGLCINPPLRAPIVFSPSGPNVCGLGGWRIQTERPEGPDMPDRQPERTPNKCSHCSVDLYCGDTCPGGGLFTEPKQENGVISVCIPPKIGGSGSTAILSALIVHELVHVQQSCNQPKDAFTGSLDKCCSSEYQAYLAQCIVFDRDGILTDLRYNYRGEALVVTPELCAATLSTLSCEELGQCSDVPIKPIDFSNAIIQSVERNKTRLSLPVSCNDAVLRLDPRAQSIIASLPSVCTPECRTEYENTIGNNLCFIGQCIEQSIEEERLVPGRMSLNVGDEAFPWDSCYGDEPLANGTPPIASQLVLPSMAFPIIPEYRPWDIVNSTDRALCQMLGLPPRMPPTLCQSEVSRVLTRPMSDALDMMIAAAKAVEDQLDPAQDIQRMTPSIGARYAATLYRMQIGPISKAYGEILGAAATMLEDMGSTAFPEQMCSRVDRVCPPPLPKP